MWGKLWKAASEAGLENNPVIFGCFLMVIMAFAHIYNGCQQSKPSDAVWTTFVNDLWSSSNGEGEEQKLLGSGGVGLTSTHLRVGGSTACWCG